MDFSHSTVLVVGDVMLDRYWQGSTQRISPEAPVPVVLVNDQSMRIGGAGNVAVNITSLGSSARLLSVYGEDEAGSDLASLLGEYGVNDHCLRTEKVATTTKLRVLSQHQQLIRLDFETPAAHIDNGALLKQFRRLLEHSDLVVLSDYGKGIISDPQSYITESNKQQKRVLVDPKYKDFMRYAGAYLITPNRKEFEDVVGPLEDQSHLEQKAQQVITQCDLGGLLITQGDKGMTLVMDAQNPVHFPTLAQEVYDVTGAGDTVIASLATGLSSGMTVEDSVHLSSVAAGIVVGRVGTSFVSLDDLLKAEHISNENLSDRKIMSSDEASAFVRQAKLQNKKIVMTNGCFDLLHSGHVNYLEQAAQLGDILIVAVNSDASVQQLKGDNRPINSLHERMSVLAGLASVDKVVMFEEETPENLICLIKPDILVKGGDYKVDEIAGRQCAGSVQLISFMEGKSTTNTVKKIKGSL
jgi:D-beta-D-heptose 7-phosphate kinase/D-beta-D-heptose 1-phosphate adenosyltransferase